MRERCVAWFLVLACGLCTPSFALAQETTPPAQPPAQPGAPAAGVPTAPTGVATPPPDMPASGRGALRRQVSDAHVFSNTTTCFYGPQIDEAQGKRLCAYQARGKLIDSATAGLSGDPEIARYQFTHKELRAFADSLMRVDVDNEEVRTVPDGLAVKLTLKAKTDPGTLHERLTAFATNEELRAAALTETDTRDRQAAEARAAAIPFESDREFAAKGMENQMREDAAFAARRIVPGMSMTNVKELLGDPPALKQAIIGPETYVCAGYGKIWVVFRDGVVSCLRTRLDYVSRYETDCHCAGDYSTILKND